VLQLGVSRDSMQAEIVPTKPAACRAADTKEQQQQQVALAQHVECLSDEGCALILCQYRQEFLVETARISAKHVA
jgi:hypothetical protein